MIQRLPVPGSDDDTWGDILNGFLQVSHNPNGTLSANAVSQAGGLSGANNLSDITNGSDARANLGLGNAATLNVGQTAGTVAAGNDSRFPGDATATTKGVLQLSGDLDGTAGSPSIRNLARVFNVTDYGAKGDGTTDNTAAFNATIQAGAGATIFVPAGTYVLTPGTFNSIPSNTRFIGAGAGNTVLKIANNYNGTNDLLQVVTASNVEVAYLTLDGNKANQTAGTQYGLFYSGVTNSSIHHVVAQNWNGDGIQLYNSTACMVRDTFSTGNAYHGFEVEQCTACALQGCRGYNNTLHGVLVSPGEVGSQGSKGNLISGNSFDHNGQYGIALNADNGDVGAYLSEGNVFSNNSVTYNAQYGINVYMQDKQVFAGNYVAFNGFFGLYGYKASNNQVRGNIFHNNSQAANGAYDEIMFEGSTSGHASTNNAITNNVIVIDGTNKARHAIAEGSAGDGPNIVMNNIIPNSGTASVYNLQNGGTQTGPVDTSTTQTVAGAKTFGATITGNQGFAVAPNAALASGMGLDAPFGTAALRFYNGNSGGNIQLVAPTGSANFYIGGSDVMDVTNAGLKVNSGLIFPVQAPTASAPSYVKGGLYFDTTLNKLRIGGATGWETVTSS